MNKAWFTCKVKYVKVDGDGKETKITESFVLDAYTYTEAEARIIQIMQAGGRSPFEVVQITKSNYTEVIRFEDAEKWFKVKVALTTYADESGKEKESNQYFLLSANDVRDAFDKTRSFMTGAMSGYVIPAITYTKIVDVFPIEEENLHRQEIEARAQGFRPMSETEVQTADEDDGYEEVSLEEMQEDETPEDLNVDAETGEILD